MRYDYVKKGATVAFVLALVGGVIALIVTGVPKDPYEEGSHWDYSIHCVDGFLWRKSSELGTIPVLHSDGTHVRCGEKRR